MGVYYRFANYTNKEIIDGYSAKSGEWRGNVFDQAVIVNYLFNNYNTTDDAPKYKFISDESGEWDECAEFEDVTADVIYSMFVEGWFDKYNKADWSGEHILRHIFQVFKKAGREDDFHHICDTIPEFEEYRKKMICNELEGKGVYG